MAVSFFGSRPDWYCSACCQSILGASVHEQHGVSFSVLGVLCNRYGTWNLSQGVLECASVASFDTGMRVTSGPFDPGLCAPAWPYLILVVCAGVASFDPGLNATSGPFDPGLMLAPVWLV